MLEHNPVDLILNELRENMTEIRKDLKESSKEVHNEFKALREDFNDLKLLVAGNYVTKEDLGAEIKEAKEGFAKKCEAIQKDIDKTDDRHSGWNKLYVTFILGTVGMFYYMYSLISQVMEKIMALGKIIDR